MGLFFLCVRMLLFFAGKFGACGKLMDVQLRQRWARLCVEGEKALSAGYFYQLISRSC